MGNFSWEDGGSLPENLSRSYNGKQNHIRSVVSEILLYRQTDTHTHRSCYFNKRKSFYVILFEYLEFTSKK